MVQNAQLGLRLVRGHVHCHHATELFERLVYVFDADPGGQQVSSREACAPAT